MKIQVYQGSPKPCSGFIVPQNDSWDSEKLLLSWLWLIMVKGHRIKSAKGNVSKVQEKTETILQLFFPSGAKTLGLILPVYEDRCKGVQDFYWGSACSTCYPVSTKASGIQLHSHQAEYPKGSELTFSQEPATGQF